MFVQAPCPFTGSPCTWKSPRKSPSKHYSCWIARPVERQTPWDASWPCLPVLAEFCVLLWFLQHLDWLLMRCSFYDQFSGRPSAPQGIPFSWRPTLTDCPLGVCSLAQCQTQGLLRWKGKREVSRQEERVHEILNSSSRRGRWVQGLATKTHLEKSSKQNTYSHSPEIQTACRPRWRRIYLEGNEAFTSGLFTCTAHSRALGELQRFLVHNFICIFKRALYMEGA